MSIRIDEVYGINEKEPGYKRNIYRMTASSAPKKSFKECIDREFSIRAYCKFEDVEKNKVILSILTSDDDEVLSGDSRTIQQSLDEFVTAFGEDVPATRCKIIASESKNNRTFLSIVAC